jgi:hypothetical protein
MGAITPAPIPLTRRTFFATLSPASIPPTGFSLVACPCNTDRISSSKGRIGRNVPGASWGWELGVELLGGAEGPAGVLAAVDWDMPRRDVG